MHQNAERLNIVVVGGGLAGLTALRSLSDEVDRSKYGLILVTARPYFTHLPGTIRAILTAEGSLEDRIRMPYDELANKNAFKVIIGELASIEDNEKQGGVITLGSGERVPYTVLVLATGRRHQGPLDYPNTLEQSDEWIARWRTNFKKAQNIVLVGGGAAATEMAGEIKDEWPRKNVSIIHTKEKLLNDKYPSGWRDGVTQKLQARGVNIILNDYVDNLEIKGDGTLLLRKKHAIKADLVVPLRGTVPNTRFLLSLGENVLTNHGYVKVLPTLQLREHPRTFAIGDIIDWVEHKQGVNCAGHVLVLVPNLLALLKGKPLKKEYQGSHEAIVISNGKNGGAGYSSFLGGITYGDWLSSLFKSKSLMIDSTRKSLGFRDKSLAKGGILPALGLGL